MPAQTGTPCIPTSYYHFINFAMGATEKYYSSLRRAQKDRSFVKKERKKIQTPVLKRLADDIRYTQIWCTQELYAPLKI